MSIILMIENLLLFYGKKEVFKGINIDFDDKGIMVLIGFFGCGKFIFLCCLNWMNDLIFNVMIMGEVNFNGYNIYVFMIDMV